MAISNLESHFHRTNSFGTIGLSDYRLSFGRGKLKQNLVTWAHPKHIEHAIKTCKQIKTPEFRLFELVGALAKRS